MARSALIVSVGAVWWSVGAAAESGLTLQQSLDAAAAANTEIRLQEQTIELRLADILSAQSLYDTVLTSSGSRSRTEEAALSSLDERTVDRTNASLDLDRSLRSGLALNLSVDVAQTDLGPGVDVNESTFGVAVVAPLIEDRRGKIGRLRLRASEEARDSAQWRLIHQAAVSGLNTAAAYWSYVAAYETLEVFTAAEVRAEQLVAELRELVEAEERPAADLIQARGNVASKRIDRISATQTLVAARRALGLVMGLPGSEIANLPPPIDGFPQVRLYRSEDSSIADLMRQAMAGRYDFRATQGERDTAMSLLEVSTETLKPSLDLTFSASYSGIEAGSGLGAFFGSLGTNVPGVSSALVLRYELPFENRSARALQQRDRAQLAQQEIRLEDLERTIRSAVRVAAEALERSALQAEQAEIAVDLNQTTVENEKKKNRLALATLFDVIFAEDRLTTALLNQVAAKQGYAVALAVLRFETSTLVDGGQSRLVIDARRLFEPPPVSGRPSGEGTMSSTRIP